MIVNTTCTITHATLADASAWYSVPFTYVTVLNVPQITVTLNDESLVYGTDYTLGVSGLQLTSAPEVGQTLVITRATPMTQTTDFQTGLIDPDEIEDALDKSAMRDQELANKIDTFSAVVEQTATLAANAWVDNLQTVPVYDQQKLLVVGPAPEAIETYLDCEIMCVEEGEGYLTFRCTNVPPTDIVVNIAGIK